LAAEKIEARPVWKPMHLQPVFSGSPSFNHGEQSVSAYLFENGICLPSGSNMTDAQFERVLTTIAARFKAQ
jgi:pyridoxal phosphate-dependent aminotransferase EpsN